MNNWTTQPGPHLRTDVFDVYIFRTINGTTDILQLRRDEAPMLNTWQPIMGHIEGAESTTAAMWRELEEEVGLLRSHAVAAYALEGVHPFYLASRDAILLSVRFAIEVAPDWTPHLNHEHDATRWVPLAEFRSSFMWPGQIAALDELRDYILNPNSLAREHLRLPV
jgi:8-oxo-dGTP pyrophosphatase MutT (NUDIX family)